MVAFTPLSKCPHFCLLTHSALCPSYFPLIPNLHIFADVILLWSGRNSLISLPVEIPFIHQGPSSFIFLQQMTSSTLMNWCISQIFIEICCVLGTRDSTMCKTDEVSCKLLYLSLGLLQQWLSNLKNKHSLTIIHHHTHTHNPQWFKKQYLPLLYVAILII